MALPFDDVLTSPDDLAALYREPSALVRKKKLDHMDELSQAVVAAAPFVLIATANDDGSCDVSPRGGPPGFVSVLDERRLAIPDLNGNNLLDSVRNVVANPHIGLLFVLPGRDETLRVAGRAWITTSPAVLDSFTSELRRPKTAIGVEVDEVFIHCAKSFRRGRVWEPASWAELPAAPTAIEQIRCQFEIEMPLAELEAQFEVGYAKDLALDRPD